MAENLTTLSEPARKILELLDKDDPTWKVIPIVYHPDIKKAQGEKHNG